MNVFRLLFPALAALALAASASAQVTVINAVPFTISASGKYQLGANLITATAAQTAITINAPNVILDLNGFFVSGPGSPTSSMESVIVVSNVSNVTIRNGTVANNYYGIHFQAGANSINHLVEDVVVTRCLAVGIYFEGRSSGSIVRRNVVTQTGGFTGTTDSNSFAIYLFGGVRAEKNVIVDVVARGDGRAYGINGLDGDFMIGNSVSNGTAPTGGAHGIQGGKYQRNSTSSFGTSYGGGIDAGSNL